MKMREYMGGIAWFGMVFVVVCLCGKILEVL